MKDEKDFFKNPERLRRASQVEQKANRVRELRRETSRLAALANKRIERLERNNLKDTPAYKSYLESGGEKFGVKGKTYNEVQTELSRLRRFINSETSTVRGATRTLKEMASNVGLKHKKVADIRAAAPKFFELASKVEQYLRNVDDMASAIGYQKIWEAINQYTSEQKINLGDADLTLDNMVDRITELVKETTDKNDDVITGWYSVK